MCRRFVLNSLQTHLSYIHKGLQTQSFLEATRVKTNLYDGFAEHIHEYFTGKH